MEGGGSQQKEHPRRRINFLFALHAEISVGVVTKWRRKRRKIFVLLQLNARDIPGTRLGPRQKWRPI